MVSLVGFLCTFLKHENEKRDLSIVQNVFLQTHVCSYLLGQDLRLFVCSYLLRGNLRFCEQLTFYSRYYMVWIANTEIGLDSNNSVIRAINYSMLGGKKNGTLQLKIKHAFFGVKWIPICCPMSIDFRSFNKEKYRNVFILIFYKNKLHVYVNVTFVICPTKKSCIYLLFHLTDKHIPVSIHSGNLLLLKSYTYHYNAFKLTKLWWLTASTKWVGLLRLWHFN